LNRLHVGQQARTRRRNRHEEGQRVHQECQLQPVEYGSGGRQVCTWGACRNLRADCFDGESSAAGTVLRHSFERTLSWLKEYGAEIVNYAARTQTLGVVTTRIAKGQ
jgi:hypothetical protein